MAREFTRKKLKQDEFVDGVWSAEQWIEDHWPTLVKWAIAVAAVALIAVVGVFWMRSRAASAERVLAEGIEKYTAATDPTLAGAGGEGGDLESALSLLEQAASKGSGATGRVARFYRAAALVRLERGEEAIPTLEDLSRGAGEDLLANAAQMLLADALSQADRHDRAIEILREAAAGKGAYAEQALYQLGVLLQAQGRTDEAREAFSDLQERYPNGPLGRQAQDKLESLG